MLLLGETPFRSYLLFSWGKSWSCRNCLCDLESVISGGSEIESTPASQPQRSCVKNSILLVNCSICFKTNGKWSLTSQEYVEACLSVLKDMPIASGSGDTQRPCIRMVNVHKAKLALFEQLHATQPRP